MWKNDLQGILKLGLTCLSVGQPVHPRKWVRAVCHPATTGEGLQEQRDA